MKYTDHYEKWHVASEAHAEKMSELYAKILQNRLPKNRNSKILDVGCGMGFALWYLKSIGYTNATGVDSDLGQVSAAQSLNLKVDHSSDTIAYISEQKELDCIIMIDVLEHVPRETQKQFLEAISRSLSKNGILILTVPNADSCIASRWRYIDWTHQMSFTEASLNFLVTSGNLKPTFIGGAEIYKVPSKSFVIFSNLFSFFCRTSSRALRRMQLIGELGALEGSSIIIDVNILMICKSGVHE